MDIVAEMKKSIAVSKKHMSETPSSSISVFSSIGGGSSTKTDSLDFRNAAGPRNSSSSTVSGMGGPLGGKLSVKDLTSKMLAFRGFSVSSKRNSDQTIESSSSTVGARTLSPTLSSNRSASPIPPSATVSYKVESQSAAPNSQTSSTTSQPQEQQQQQQNRQATAYQGAFQQGYQQEYYPQYQYQSTFAEPPGPSSTSAFMSTTSTTSTTATTKELPLPTAASTLPLAREIMEIYDHRSSTASSAGSFAVPQSVTTAGAPSIPFVAPIPVQPQTDSLASVLPYKSKEAPFNRFKYSAYSAFVSEAVARGHVGL
ncbi:hypothetical protein BC830DRAFT_1137688 [Chytriomyces sp. MP71]|nr:hypothetical protein BC830DRAFT_1137688 [Chytriomyces sp. MP71]